MLLFFLAVGTVAGLRTGPPAMFVVLSVASCSLEVARGLFLWHPDTNAYLRRRVGRTCVRALMTGP